MVHLTLINVDRAQKNKRNLDTMTLWDSDDERGDKEDRYEHDDEGSLYAESTGDATKAASECAADDTTGNKTKETTAAAVAKPRKKYQKPLDLNRLGIADESVTMLEDHHSAPPPVALLLGRPSSCGVYFVLE
jgi:hypothetical protein